MINQEKWEELNRKVEEQETQQLTDEEIEVLAAIEKLAN